MTEAPTERDLAQVRSGDSRALDALVERHLPALRAFVRLSSGPALRAYESSSDLVQSVCREVIRDAAALEWQGDAAFRQWLFQHAERKIRSRVRYLNAEKRDHRRRIHAGTAGDADARLNDCYASICSPSQHAEAREELERLERAFELLTEQEREIILYARVVGLSAAALGERIGQTPHYARTLLSRAVARLATLLDRPRPSSA